MDRGVLIVGNETRENMWEDAAAAGHECPVIGDKRWLNGTNQCISHHLGEDGSSVDYRLQRTVMFLWLTMYSANVQNNITLMDILIDNRL